MIMNIPEDLEVDNGQVKRIVEMYNDVRNLPRYTYDWSGTPRGENSLEEDVDVNDRRVIQMVGYGSLLNTSSAAQTISAEHLKNRRPIIAFGVTRIFNYSMGILPGGYGTPQSPVDTAALNIRFTNSIEDSINAVLIDIPQAEISALRNREIGYNFEPVVCMDWKREDRELFYAYILHCPDKPGEENSFINNDLMPHRNYYEVCKSGASEFGESFKRYWLSTTFLADGITPVRKWETQISER